MGLLKIKLNNKDGVTVAIEEDFGNGMVKECKFLISLAERMSDVIGFLFLAFGWSIMILWMSRVEGFLSVSGS